MKENFLSSTRSTTLPTTKLHNEGKLMHASFLSIINTSTLPTTTLQHEGKLVPTILAQASTHFQQQHSTNKES
jgi:hypothetical protein